MVTPKRPTPAAPPPARGYADTAGHLPPNNSGVPPGGITGAALVKSSNLNFATEFSTGIVGTVTNTAGPLLAHAVLVGNDGANDIKSLSSLGSSGQVLTSAGPGVDPIWATPSASTGGSGFVNPMSTAGDLIYGTTGGAPLRLGIGSSGQVLTVVSNLPTWSTPAAGLTNPMTTPGDIIVGGVAGAPGRLGIGTNGQILTVVAGAEAWAGSVLESDCFNVVNSLQTGVPFPVTDTSGATNVFTIALGGIVTLWDSVALAWTNYAMTSQITTAIGTVSAAFTSEDWYLWQNSGTPTIERDPWRSDTITVVTANTVHYGVAHNLSTGDPQVYTNSGGALPVGLVANTLYWVITVPTSQDVTLSTTFGGTQLSITAGGTGTSTAWHSRQRSSTTVTLQDGRLCKSTDKTRRYIGSVWYDSTTTTSDTQGGTTTQIGGKRYVYNYYRRRALGMKVFDSTSFWTYVTATARSANNVFANRVEFFIGIQEQYVSAETTAGIGIASNSAPGFSGVGLNTNAVFSGDRGPALNGSASSIEIVVKGNDRQIPPLGYNFYSWIEYGPSSGTGNWIGSLSNSHAGMQALIEA